METKEIKIAYIGGGSREWARNLMFDLALEPALGGQVFGRDARGARPLETPGRLAIAHDERDLASDSVRGDGVAH